MSIQQKQFSRFIKMLNDNDCLQYVILVGSWCEFLYRETQVLGNFIPNIRTLDMDFLIKNLRKPEPSVNVISLAKNEGYLVENDRLTNVTKIYDKAGLEIEFLIENKGAGIEASLKTNLGVTAQTLRHMNILTKNTIDVEYLGMHINIPCPEAYTVHKIVINNERKSKMKKDQEAIKNIWSYLNSQKLIEIRTLLTKKEKKVFDAYIEEHNLKCDIL